MTNENIIQNHIIGEMSFKIKATKCTFTSSEEFFNYILPPRIISAPTLRRIQSTLIIYFRVVQTMTRGPKSCPLRLCMARAVVFQQNYFPHENVILVFFSRNKLNTTRGLKMAHPCPI